MERNELYDLARSKGMTHDEAEQAVELVTDPEKWDAFVKAIKTFGEAARSLAHRSTCIAEGHWTTVFDTETGVSESLHDPDGGPCEYPEI